VKGGDKKSVESRQLFLGLPVDWYHLFDLVTFLSPYSDGKFDLAS